MLRKDNIYYTWKDFGVRESWEFNEIILYILECHEEGINMHSKFVFFSLICQKHFYNVKVITNVIDILIHIGAIDKSINLINDYLYYIDNFEEVIYLVDNGINVSQLARKKKLEKLFKKLK